MSRVWDKFLTERDRAMLNAFGYSQPMGFGKRPALLIIDVSYGFTGDKPEPLLESMKRWRNSCGEESWQAIAVVDKMAKLFRRKRLPVIYTTGIARSDNWDTGSWSWKTISAPDGASQDKPSLDPNKIVAEIEPQPQDIVVYKQKPSGFFGSNLISYLNLLGCDSLIVTGVSTSGCVRATVVDAFSYNFRCTIAEDGCFDRSQSSHAITLCDLNTKYADVLSSTEIIAHIQTLSDDLFPNLPKA